MTTKITNTSSGATDRSPFRLHFICASLTILILLSDLAIPLGVAMGVPYVAVILLSLWSPKKQFTIIAAIVTSILTVAAIFLKPPIEEMWKAFSNRGLALFAIWVTAGLGMQIKRMESDRQQALHEREEAVESLKTLRGLLPICSSCKNIRDDQGSWTQIENYVMDHSEADFTHSLCPDCLEKLYPDIMKGKSQ